jgi:DNA repair exonuclease SbcCD ATPase subunit
MSLEKIDQYIRELEAIKYYGKVKKERDEALSRIKELEKSLEEKGELKKKLEEKEKEVRDLKGALEGMNKELQETKLEINKLKSKINELENLKVTVEGKTLIEAKNAFLVAMNDEIEKRAHARFNSMKSEWEKAEKQKEIFKTATELLKQVIEKPDLLPKELIELSKKVKEIINSEVEKRLNSEFHRRVQEELDRKASSQLKQMMEIEWPKWYEINIEPKVIELERKINANVMSLLRGPWLITCDKCGMKQAVELTPERMEILLRPERMEILLRNGYVLIECQNPNCTDLLWRHKINIPLRDLISYLMRSS